MERKMLHIVDFYVTICYYNQMKKELINKIKLE